jgi:hypothetical protein
MHHLTRRALAAALGATLAIGIWSGVAVAAPAQSATADVTSGPFHIQFTAHRAADAPSGAATGDFNAHFTIGGATLFSVGGPVTCLDVRGNRMGLFYPITRSSPSLFSMLNSGVFIFLTRNASGKPSLVGFLPVPFSSSEFCVPSLTLLPVTSGTATFTS